MPQKIELDIPQTAEERAAHTQPKTWNNEEIADIIIHEIKELRLLCRLHREPFRDKEAAELIVAALNDAGLIEYTP